MHIVTGKDIAKRDGVPSFRLWLRAQSVTWRRRLVNQVDENAAPVVARIDRERLIAECDVCHGAEYVDPDDPVFFCISCGNAAVGGKLRRVIIPADVQEVLDGMD